MKPRFFLNKFNDVRESRPAPTQKSIHIPYDGDLQSRGIQIPDARSPWRLNFVRWRLMLVGPQHYGTCFMSPFWRLKFWGCFPGLGKFVHPFHNLLKTRVRVYGGT